MKIEYKRKLLDIHLNPARWIIAFEISNCGIKIRISRLFIGIFTKIYIEK